MRLDEWQKYIDSEFVGDTTLGAGALGNKSARAVVDAKPDLAVEVHQTLEIGAAPDDAASPEPAEEPQTTVAGDAPAAGEEAADWPPASDETAAQADDLNPDSAPAGASLRSAEPSHWHSADSKIAPFAEYIAVRQKISQINSSAARESQGSEADPFAESSVDGAIAREPVVAPAPKRETETVAPPSLPLELSSEAAEILRLLSTSKLPGTDAQVEENRAALLLRIRDPVLTMESTALLLGVSMLAMKRIMERGSLVPCAPAMDGIPSDSRQPRDGKLRCFQLSDILAWLAANSSDLNP